MPEAADDAGGDPLRAAHDVAVGEDVARGVEHHPRARLPHRAGRREPAAEVEEASRVVGQVGLLLASRQALRVSLELDVQADDAGADGWVFGVTSLAAAARAVGATSGPCASRECSAEGPQSRRPSGA
jgi:hypothetical protein